MNDNVRIYHVDEYCEGASHFSFSERKDVVLLEDYKELEAENEELKRELKQMEVQDQVVIDNLRKENAKLKDEVDFLSMRRDNFCDAMDELVENGAVDTFDWTGGLIILAKDTNYEYLRNENAKLKCLALHAMRDLFDYKGHKLNYEGYKIWKKYCHKYIEFDKAYRNAKKALMEGK